MTAEACCCSLAHYLIKLKTITNSKRTLRVNKIPKIKSVYQNAAWGRHTRFCAAPTLISAKNIFAGKPSTNKLDDLQKARSVRSFAVQLNLTKNPGRSSLVQIDIGSFMWMELWVLLLFSFSQDPRNGTDLRQTKTKLFVKNNTQLATASAAAAIPAVPLSVSLLCVLHGVVIGTQTLWMHAFV